jgi:deleted-in-malignant-brain-tumors protein 1
MAGAKCQIRTDCRDGDIRLAGVISNPLKGRVEICYDGVWGTTCNNPWNSLNAMVVCRQLGHATLGAGVSGVLGNGNGPILLHNVICSGSEYRLLDCSNQILTIPTCSRAAGVTCQPGKAYIVQSQISPQHYRIMQFICNTYIGMAYPLHSIHIRT